MQSHTTHLINNDWWLDSPAYYYKQFTAYSFFTNKIGDHRGTIGKYMDTDQVNCWTNYSSFVPNWDMSVIASWEHGGNDSSSFPLIQGASPI